MITKILQILPQRRRDAEEKGRGHGRLGREKQSPANKGNPREFWVGLARRADPSFRSERAIPLVRKNRTANDADPREWQKNNFGMDFKIGIHRAHALMNQIARNIQTSSASSNAHFILLVLNPR
jgi:hypothetical protein